MKRAVYLILTGIAFGVLIAPRKGSETRRKLVKGFRNWKDDMISQANETASTVVSEGKDMLNKGKNLADQAKKEIRTEMNKE